MEVDDRIVEKAKEWNGKPYKCHDRKMACILFVVEFMDEFSKEFEEIHTRLKLLSIRDKRKAIVEGQIAGFIKTSNLHYKDKPDRVGDVLLLNEYSSARLTDHIAVYLGNNQYLHLKRHSALDDKGEITSLTVNAHKLISVVRAWR